MRVNTLTVDDRQLAVNAMVGTLKEIDPEGNHVGLIFPEEAISYLRDHPVDVAFLDVEMPKMNGLTLAQEMTLLQPKINIVFVTGHGEYALDAYSLYASGYLMKPASREEVEKCIENLRHPTSVKKKVEVRCFGNFEVFLDGAPLVFKRSKSKEVFAYLVDNRGAFCSTGELIGALWEDEDVTNSKMSQIRAFTSDMRKTFEEVGIMDMVIKKHNEIAVNVNRIDCDYYHYMDKDPEAQHLFMGEYMKQYTWSELRTGELMMKN